MGGLGRLGHVQWTSYLMTTATSTLNQNPGYTWDIHDDALPYICAFGNRRDVVLHMLDSQLFAPVRECAGLPMQAMWGEIGVSGRDASRRRLHQPRSSMTGPRLWRKGVQAL